MRIVHRLLPVLLLTGGVGLTGTAEAQVLPHYVLDPVVITATRTPVAAGLTGASVEVVTGEQLRARGSTTVAEALAHLPGVAIARAGEAAGTTSLFLRGAKGEHLLVLIDGVPVSDPASPGGGFDWSILTVDAIERIEIVKGPQSTLYGSAAMAGVVHIITRRPGAAPAPYASVEAGSYQVLNTTVGTTARMGPVALRMELARRQMGGLSSAAEAYGNTEPDAWQLWSGQLRAHLPLAQGELEGRLRGNRSRHDLDDFGGPGGDDPNHIAWQSDRVGSLRWSRVHSPHHSQSLLVGLSWIHRWLRDRPDADHPDERADGAWRGRVLTGEWQHTLLMGRHHLLGGISLRRETGRSHFAYQGWGAAYESRFQEQSQWARALYLQQQFSLGSADLVVGGRLDHYTDYGLQPTGRINATLPVKGFRLRGSIGTGFRAPSLYQRHDPVYGSATLDAERTVAAEGGLELHATERGRVRLTVYRQRVSDLIDFDWSVSRYANTGRAELRGWEAAAEWEAGRGIKLEAGMDRTRAQDLEIDQRLLRRPERTLWLGAAVAPAGPWSGGLRVRHTGRREDLDFSSFPAERTVLEPVTLLEGEVVRRIAPGLALRLRGENLTDARPVWVWGYGTRGRLMAVALLVSTP